MSEAQIQVSCRFCEQNNRFLVERALKDLASPICGRCRQPLLLVRGEPLPGLDKDAITHPWDREALEKLQAIPYVPELTAKLIGSTYDPLQRFQLLGGALEISEKQLPHIYRLYLEAAGRIDVDPPPLFLTQDPVPQAWTSGVAEPIVVLTSGLLNLLEDKELVGVMGHELTHVKLGHVHYRTLALLLARGALKILDFAGLAKIALRPIQVMLFRWMQMSELSADRGELVAAGCLRTVVRAHMRLAGGVPRGTPGFSEEAFIDQASAAEALRDSRLFVNLMEMMDDQQRTHPLSVWRAHHVVTWARTPAFFQTLVGQRTLFLEGE